MKNPFVKFTIKIGVVSIILSIIFALVFYFSDSIKFNVGYVIVFVAYLLIILGLHFYLLKSLSKRIAVFNRTFMILTAIKLILIVTLMYIVSHFQTQNFKIYLGELFTLYIIFSVIEVKDALNRIKKLTSSK